jgi:hypothetical protein
VDVALDGAEEWVVWFSAQPPTGCESTVDADQLIRALSPGADMPRLTLYLNADRINEVFEQRVAAVKELVLTKGIGGELSGGYLGFLGGKLSKRKDVGAKIELTPILKALLLEFEEGENGRLVDLTSSEATRDAFVHFVGGGRIFPPWEVVSPDPEVGLESKLARAIQEEREQYERWIRRAWDHAERPETDDLDSPTMLNRTLVWIGSGRQLLAAIASDEWMVDSTLARFAKTPPFGVLGRFQRSDGAIAFLSPLWIWR